MLNSPYGPKDVRRVSFQRLPNAIREAGISMIERKLATGTITDLVTISDSEWHQVCRRFNAIQRLAEHPGRLGRSAKEIASMFGASDRTGRRWLSVYRRNPDIVALLPRQKGQRMGNRRLKSSRAEESHPHSLLEPHVNVTIHPAPGVQPCFKCPERE